MSWGGTQNVQILELLETVMQPDVIVHLEGSKVVAKDKANNVIASGTAGTDDLTVIQAALDALTESRTHKETLLIKDNMTIDGKIEVPSYTTIIIRKKLTHEDGQPTATPIFEINNKTQIDIIGGELDGNKANQTELINAILVTNDSSYILIEGVKSVNSRGFAIYCYESNYIDIRDCIIEDCAESGIAIEGFQADASYIHIINNKVKNTGLTGTSAKNGIHLEGSHANGFYPRHCLVAHNRVEGARGNGITLSGIYSTRILGNTVKDCYIEGIWAGSSYDLTIVGNVLDGNDVGDNAGYENGIRIDDSGVTPASTDILIMGNRIFNHDGNAIAERGTADHNTIIGNVVRNNAAAAIATVGANTIVKHNKGYVTEKATLSGTFAIDSTGVKTVTVAHGLGVTPAKEDIALTVVEETDVDDWAFDLLKVESVDATNVTVKINVSTASATASATAKMAVRAGKP